MQLFSRSSTESKGFSQRLGSRGYIFVVTSVATFLLIIALKRPAPVAITAQARLTVPPLAAGDTHYAEAGRPSWTERLTSQELLAAAGNGLRVTDGLSADEARRYLALWTARVRGSLSISEQPNASEEGSCVTIRYADVTPENSVTVLTSLLNHARSDPTALSTGASAGPRSHTLSDEVLAAEDRVILAENAIDEFIAAEIERRREKMFALRVEQAEEQHRAQVLQRAREAEQRAIAERAAQEELEVNNENPGHAAANSRNPEYDVLERALVKAQTERQELLSRFATDHAAVSRVELEIGQLELLLDQTPKFLAVASGHAEPTERGPEALVDLEFDLEPGAADAVPLPPEEINMELELARIEKSDAYRELQEDLVEVQQALAVVVDQSTQESATPLVITEAPQVVGHHQPGLSMWQLVGIGSVAGLVGFIFAVLKNLVNIPEVLYSVKDVKKSLGLPITACLSLDNTPDIPAPPTVVRPKLSRVAVRVAELTLLALVGIFLLTFIAQPRLFGEFISDPLATYMTAFRQLRSYVPIPYLLN